MDRTSGEPWVKICLIDGPVAKDHLDLPVLNVRHLPGKLPGDCARTASNACIHGTFVAGILVAKRGSPAPAIAPGCTLLVRPIFAENSNPGAEMPSATPEELAAAIIDTVDADAHVINLSAALAEASLRGEQRLGDALDYAAKRGVILVAAAGNTGTVGSSVITRHPWVIPVVSCDAYGNPAAQSNLGNSIGRRGLSAPGDKVVSLGVSGKTEMLSGTSAAAPFVTAAIALLFSEFPAASVAEVKLAIAGSGPRNAIVPPLLDAWSAYQQLASNYGARRIL
jgi:subtilisin family serine protease